MAKKELAKRMDIEQSRVSQIFHNPGNLTLKLIVRAARAVGIKVALIAYNDGDRDNVNGPIVPEVFYECWNRCGNPLNMFEVDTENTRVPLSDLEPQTAESVYLMDESLLPSIVKESCT